MCLLQNPMSPKTLLLQGDNWLSCRQAGKSFSQSGQNIKIYKQCQCSQFFSSWIYIDRKCILWGFDQTYTKIIISCMFDWLCIDLSIMIPAMIQSIKSVLLYIEISKSYIILGQCISNSSAKWSLGNNSYIYYYRFTCIPDWKT